MHIHFHTQEATIREAVDAFVSVWNSDATYFEVTTSGSTGTPKTIRIQKEYARASAETTCAFLGLQKNDRALLCLSPHTIAGKMMIIRAIVCGMELHVSEPSANPFDSLDVPMDFVAVVPYQLAAIVQHTPSVLTPSLKVIVGGGPVSGALEATVKGYPSSFFHTFGMTETLSHIAMRDLKEENSLYKTVPGVTVSEEDGCLVLSAPHLGIDRLKTNDCIACIDATTFRWVGRADFVINSGGVKIHPEQVEKVLSPMISVPFFVTGVHDTSLGQKAVLCLEGSDQIPSKEAMLGLLPKYHIPKVVYLFDRFVRTESGKINRLRTMKENTFNEKPVL